MQPFENKMNDMAEQKLKNASHYHGDAVRVIFLIIVLVLIITTPYFKFRLLFWSFGAIIAIIGFLIFAGLTNPKSTAIIVIDFIISILSTLTFGYQAIILYKGNYFDLFFLAVLVLFILSASALYFSSKTLRGNMLYKKGI